MTKANGAANKPFGKGRRVKRTGEISRPVDHRVLLNDRLIATLRARDGVLAGIGPHAPLNPISGIHLRTANALSVRLTQLVTGSQDPRWMTFLQIKAQGLRVRDGSKGTWVQFGYLRKSTEADIERGAEELEGGSPAPREWFDMRHVCVFNAEDVVGLSPYVAPIADPAQAPMALAIRAALLMTPSDVPLATLLMERVGALLPDAAALSPAALELRLLLASTQLFDFMGEMVGDEPAPRLQDIDALASLLKIVTGAVRPQPVLVRLCVPVMAVLVTPSSSQPVMVILLLAIVLVTPTSVLL